MINLSKKEKFFIFTIVFLASLISFSFIQAVCSDSDGGTDGSKDYDIQGTCTDYRGTPFTDFCVADYLTEYWCDGGAAGSCSAETYHNCECGCSGGACQACQCSDTDNGNYPCVRGTCKDFMDRQYMDTCSGNYVVEYYCSGNYCNSQNIYYSYGCHEGKCITGPCYDSDGGENYYAYGYCQDYVGGSLETFTDYCQCNPATYAYDFYCQNNACVSNGMYCGYDQCTDSGICYVSPFDFSIAVNPTSGSVNQGSSVSTNVELSLSSGTTQSVTVSASVTGGWPTGMSASFPSGFSCSPTCSLTMTVNTTASTLTGPTNINVCGTGGSQNHCTVYQVTVITGSAQINPPGVTTNAATNIAQTSATLNGTLTSMGGATSCLVWFEWGPTTSLGNITSVQTKSATDSFSAPISGLTAGQTYYFKAFAKNGGSW